MGKSVSKLRFTNGMRGILEREHFCSFFKTLIRVPFVRKYQKQIENRSLSDKEKTRISEILDKEINNFFYAVQEVVDNVEDHVGLKLPGNCDDATPYCDITLIIEDPIITVFVQDYGDGLSRERFNQVRLNGKIGGLGLLNPKFNAVDEAVLLDSKKGTSIKLVKKIEIEESL